MAISAHIGVCDVICKFIIMVQNWTYYSLCVKISTHGTFLLGGY